MSREIKFRAWDTKKREMSFFELFDVCGLDWYEQDYFRVMEFTNLKDVDGKEIYEGDVIGYSWEKLDPAPKDVIDNLPDGAVVPNSLIHGREAGETRVEVKVPDIYLYDDVDEYKIIGNIYENPGLVNN